MRDADGIGQLHLRDATEPHRDLDPIAVLCGRLPQLRELCARQHRESNIASRDIAVKEFYSLGANTLQDIDSVRVAGYIPYGYTAAPMADASKATVGQRIAAIRDSRGMTQAELADLLKIRQPSVNKVEKSKGVPKVPTLMKYAKALSCTLDDFLIGHDTEYEKLVRDRTRHGRDTTLEPHTQEEEGPNVAASGFSSARIQELQRERDDLKRRVTELERAARQLFAVVRPPNKDAESGRNKPTRSRPHRKTTR